MKIVEKEDGRRIVVFEDSDAALRDPFYAIHAEGKEIADQGCALEKQRDEITHKLEIAVARLKLHRLETHHATWDPINEAVAKVLGVKLDDVPNMKFDGNTQELVIDD